MSIRLSPHNRWHLFIGMVCETLTREGYAGDKYDLASSLDMTFDELDGQPIVMWQSLIDEELSEYKEKEGAEFFK